ncbi:hypothetical protein ACIA5E_26520 [Nocardia asteroides]|uniref:hypothetical protein n=1 Tax=Nocardia asteroides TaxID=1824 RepID=UPI00378A7DC9
MPIVSIDTVYGARGDDHRVNNDRPSLLPYCRVWQRYPHWTELDSVVGATRTPRHRGRFRPNRRTTRCRFC